MKALIFFLQFEKQEASSPKRLSMKSKCINALLRGTILTGETGNKFANVVFSILISKMQKDNWEREISTSYKD